MEVGKEIYEEVFEACIKDLINQQASLVIEINDLQNALDLHLNDRSKYHLRYDLDEETGVYSYKRIAKKKIGF